MKRRNRDSALARARRARKYPPRRTITIVDEIPRFIMDWQKMREGLALALNQAAYQISKAVEAMTKP